MCTLQVMSAPRTESLEADQNPPTDTTQDSVPTNIFIRILQEILGFTTAQVRILADDKYDTQEMVLY